MCTPVVLVSNLEGPLEIHVAVDDLGFSEEGVVPKMRERLYAVQRQGPHSDVLQRAHGQNERWIYEQQGRASYPLDRSDQRL